MAKVAHLGPLAAILVNILQHLSMGSICKNVPLNELFQLSQSWEGGGGGVAMDRQLDRRHRRVTCRVAPCELQGATKKDIVLERSNGTSTKKSMVTRTKEVSEHRKQRLCGVNVEVQQYLCTLASNLYSQV